MKILGFSELKILISTNDNQLSVFLIFIPKIIDLNFLKLHWNFQQKAVDGIIVFLAVIKGMSFQMYHQGAYRQLYPYMSLLFWDYAAVVSCPFSKISGSLVPVVPFPPPKQQDYCEHPSEPAFWEGLNIWVSLSCFNSVTNTVSHCVSASVSSYVIREW